MTSTPSDADTATLEIHPVVQPRFPAARHGYDRVEVDEYLARLAEWTAQAQARAQSDDRAIAGYQARIAELEEELGEVKASASPAAHVEAAASRAVHAIEIALAEADTIRGRANDEAAATTATAREQALETVRAAQRAVRRTRRRRQPGPQGRRRCARNRTSRGRGGRAVDQPTSRGRGRGTHRRRPR
jgi:DivIVA domain-containing protein